MAREPVVKWQLVDKILSFQATIPHGSCAQVIIETTEMFSSLQWVEAFGQESIDRGKPIRISIIPASPKKQKIIDLSNLLALKQSLRLRQRQSKGFLYAQNKGWHDGALQICNDPTVIGENGVKSSTTFIIRDERECVGGAFPLPLFGFKWSPDDIISPSNRMWKSPFSGEFYFIDFKSIKPTPRTKISMNHYTENHSNVMHSFFPQDYPEKSRHDKSILSNASGVENPDHQNGLINAIGLENTDYHQSSLNNTIDVENHDYQQSTLNNASCFENTDYSQSSLSNDSGVTNPDYHQSCLRNASGVENLSYLQSSLSDVSGVENPDYHQSSLYNASGVEKPDFHQSSLNNASCVENPDCYLIEAYVTKSSSFIKSPLSPLSPLAADQPKSPNEFSNNILQQMSAAENKQKLVTKMEETCSLFMKTEDKAYLNFDRMIIKPENQIWLKQEFTSTQEQTVKTEFLVKSECDPLDVKPENVGISMVNMETESHAKPKHLREYSLCFPEPAQCSQQDTYENLNVSSQATKRVEGIPGLFTYSQTAKEAQSTCSSLKSKAAEKYHPHVQTHPQSTPNHSSKYPKQPSQGPAQMQERSLPSTCSPAYEAWKKWIQNECQKEDDELVKLVLLEICKTLTQEYAAFLDQPDSHPDFQEEYEKFKFTERGHLNPSSESEHWQKHWSNHVFKYFIHSWLKEKQDCKTILQNKYDELFTIYVDPSPSSFMNSGFEDSIGPCLSTPEKTVSSENCVSSAEGEFIPLTSAFALLLYVKGVLGLADIPVKKLYDKMTKLEWRNENPFQTLLTIESAYLLFFYNDALQFILKEKANVYDPRLVKLIRSVVPVLSRLMALTRQYLEIDIRLLAQYTLHKNEKDTLKFIHKIHREMRKEESMDRDRNICSAVLDEKQHLLL